MVSKAHFRLLAIYQLFTYILIRNEGKAFRLLRFLTHRAMQSKSGAPHICAALLRNGVAVKS